VAAQHVLTAATAECGTEELEFVRRLTETMAGRDPACSMCTRYTAAFMLRTDLTACSLCLCCDSWITRHPSRILPSAVPPRVLNELASFDTMSVTHHDVSRRQPACYLNLFVESLAPLSRQRVMRLALHPGDARHQPHHRGARPHAVRRLP
jgi:hypothetical protein